MMLGHVCVAIRRLKKGREGYRLLPLRATFSAVTEPNLKPPHTIFFFAGPRAPPFIWAFTNEILDVEFHQSRSA